VFIWRKWTVQRCVLRDRYWAHLWHNSCPVNIYFWWYDFLLECLWKNLGVVSTTMCSWDEFVAQESGPWTVKLLHFLPFQLMVVRLDRSEVKEKSLGRIPPINLGRTVTRKHTIWPWWSWKFSNFRVGQRSRHGGPQYHHMASYISFCGLTMTSFYCRAVFWWPVASVAPLKRNVPTDGVRKGNSHVGTSVYQFVNNCAREIHKSSTFFSNPEDGGGTFLRNVGNHLQGYMTSRPRRLQSTPSP
jgi:hypothetical protein